MTFCTKCGTENEDIATFCGSCGNSMKKPTETEEQPLKQPPIENHGQEQPEKQPYQQPQPPQQQPDQQLQPPQQQPYQQPQPPQQQPYTQPQQPYHRQQQQFGGFAPTGYELKPPRTGWLTFTLVINWIGIAFISLFAILIFAIAGEFQSIFGVGGSSIAAFGFIFVIIAGLVSWLTLELNKYNATARTVQIVLSALIIVGSISDIAENILLLVLVGMQLYALAFHEETIRLFKPIG